MVTVVKTITEHTNGRRLRPDGQWERRVGVRSVKSEVGKTTRPRQETLWEICPAPRKAVYGSEEHNLHINGGDVHYEIAGIEGGSYDLDEAEAEVLFRHYMVGVLSVGLWFLAR